MKLKARFKIGIDIIMTILLFILMGYQFWGDLVHECAGAMMFLLFILHHFINWNWYKALLKGKYNAVRIFQCIINILLFIAMLALMISGIMMSRYVFAFLDIQGGLSFARLLHILGSYWGVVLMAIHIGMHWGVIIAMSKKTLPFQLHRRVIQGLLLGIAIYGMYVFMKRDFLTYMFLQNQFVFIDFNEMPLLFYIDYLALIAMFAIFAYQSLKKLREKSINIGKLERYRKGGNFT